MPLPCVGALSGKGMFQAFELVNDKESKAPTSPSMKREIEARMRGRHFFVVLPERYLTDL